MKPMDAAGLKAAREAAVARFLAVASALKADAGVAEHEIRDALRGYACASGKIVAPEGRTRRQLYILAHECAHVALDHFNTGKPRHVEEMEAEKWAIAALRRHGIPVPRGMIALGKRYVAFKIRQAERRGAKRIDPAARAYAKRRVK